MTDFFSKTFWAHQFKDMRKLGNTLNRLLEQLEEWEFITAKQDFVSAADLNDEARLNSTATGKRVAELYLDPFTANHIISCIRKANSFKAPFPLLLMVASTLEMRPPVRAGAKDHEDIQEMLMHYDGQLLQEEPSMYDEEYGDFLNAVKTAMFINEWMEEKDEVYLLEKFRIRPGEIHAKLNIADWLLYSAVELSKLINHKEGVRELMKTKLRVSYGIKEELFPLIRLKGIGRVRARRLFNNRITDIAAVKRADMATLTQLIGAKVAADIKEQVGQKVFESADRDMNAWN